MSDFFESFDPYENCSLIGFAVGVFVGVISSILLFKFCLKKKKVPKGLSVFLCTFLIFVCTFLGGVIGENFKEIVDSISQSDLYLDFLESFDSGNDIELKPLFGLGLGLGVGVAAAILLAIFFLRKMICPKILKVVLCLFLILGCGLYGYVKGVQERLDAAESTLYRPRNFIGDKLSEGVHFDLHGVVNAVFDVFGVEEKAGGLLLGDKRDFLSTLIPLRPLPFLVAGLFLVIILIVDKVKRKQNEKPAFNKDDSIKKDDKKVFVEAKSVQMEKSLESTYINKNPDSCFKQNSLESKNEEVVAVNKKTSSDFNFNQIKSSFLERLKVIVAAVKERCKKMVNDERIKSVLNNRQNNKNVTNVSLKNIIVKALVIVSVILMLYLINDNWYDDFTHLVLVLIGLGFIPAVVAKKFGRDFWTFYLGWNVLWLVALIVRIS